MPENETVQETAEEKIVTFLDAVHLLTLAVKERGADYVYPGWAGTCSNVHSVHVEGKGHVEYIPGCIVGTAVALGGIATPEWMAAHANAVGAGTLARILLKHKNISFTEKALRLLNIAQSRQDNGHTWGYSVEYALRTVQDFYENDTHSGYEREHGVDDL